MKRQTTANILSGKPTSIRPMYPVGAGFDIPTGSYITGKNGSMILNGGVGGITVAAGAGNMFKTTLLIYLMLASTNNYNKSGYSAPMHTYDTEDNMIFNIERLNQLAANMNFIENDPLYNENVWSIISKSEMPAEEWLTLLHTMVNDKVKSAKLSAKNRIVYDELINRITNKPIELPILSSVAIDSLSDMESGKAMDIVKNGNIEESNTVYLNQAMFKTKVIKDLPRLSVTASINFFITAHVGSEINMASGPYAPQPQKSLQHMKAGQKLKGVADKLYFLSTHMYYIQNVSLLINKTTKMPEFPLKGVVDNSTDLNLMKIKPIRNKTGPSGHVIEIIVSQTEGIKPELSDFYRVKTSGYGLIGNLQNYALALLPDVKLSRTTVRSKLDESDTLKRAVKIQSDMLQMETFMKQYRTLFMSPENLYNKINKLGYDWDIILNKTTDLYTPHINSFELKYLSTLDILQLANGIKTYEWLKKNKDNKNGKK